MAFSLIDVSSVMLLSNNASVMETVDFSGGCTDFTFTGAFKIGKIVGVTGVITPHSFLKFGFFCVIYRFMLYLDFLPGIFYFFFRRFWLLVIVAKVLI